MDRSKMLQEMTAKSAYVQQIENDVRSHSEALQALARRVESWVAPSHQELVQAAGARRGCQTVKLGSCKLSWGTYL